MLGQLMEIETENYFQKVYKTMIEFFLTNFYIILFCLNQYKASIYFLTYIAISTYTGEMKSKVCELCTSNPIDTTPVRQDYESN